MKNKKLKGYPTLKEARAKARERCLENPRIRYIDIFLESDDSFTIGVPNDKKAKFHIAVDKSGQQYLKKYTNRYGFKMLDYCPV